MATPLGLRTVSVVKDAPANNKVVLGRGQGNIVYTEVTNKTASDVDFIVNDFIEESGIAGVAIPIPANSTRAIPMTLYNFKATGVVTVVAYGM